MRREICKLIFIINSFEKSSVMIDSSALAVSLTSGGNVSERRREGEKERKIM